MPNPVEVGLSVEALDEVKGGRVEDDDIAIVIPVHEPHVGYLQHAIESVLALEETPAELVVVEDGRCGAARIWGRYVPAMIQAGITPSFRQHPASKGAAAARNTGIRATTTKWILCLDADDRLKPHALTAWRDALQDEPEADVVVFGYEAFGTGLNGEPATGTRVYDEHGFDLIEAYRADKRLACAASPFKRTLWERQPYREDFGIFEDTAFWLDCARQGAYFASVQEPVVDVRYHADRTSFNRPDEERTANRKKLDQIAHEAEVAA